MSSGSSEPTRPGTNQEGNTSMLCANLMMVLGSLAQLSPSPDPGPVTVLGSVVDASSEAGWRRIWLSRAARPEDDAQIRHGALLGGKSLHRGSDAGLCSHARSDAEGRSSCSRRSAVQAHARRPDRRGQHSNTPKNMARIYVAQLLARHGKDRWQRIYEYFMYLWTPDQRYL